MILNTGEHIHTIHRQLFLDDVRRQTTTDAHADYFAQRPGYREYSSGACADRTNQLQTSDQRRHPGDRRDRLAFGHHEFVTDEKLLSLPC